MPCKAGPGPEPPLASQFTCPEDQLAAEVEFAVAYAQACDPQHSRDRRWYAEQIALMLMERAGKGLSGMRVEPMIAKQGLRGVT